MPVVTILSNNLIIFLSYILFGFNIAVYFIFLMANTAATLLVYFVYAWKTKVSTAKSVMKKIGNMCDILFFLIPSVMVVIPLLFIFPRLHILPTLSFSNTEIIILASALTISFISVWRFEIRRAYNIGFEGLKLFYMPLWSLAYFVLSLYVLLINMNPKIHVSVVVFGLIGIKTVVDIIIEYDLPKLKKKV